MIWATIDVEKILPHPTAVPALKVHLVDLV
jgi:hypothetical protein